VVTENLKLAFYIAGKRRNVRFGRLRSSRLVVGFLLELLFKRGGRHDLKHAGLT
jgi:hypothetical protein